MSTKDLIREGHRQDRAEHRTDIHYSFSSLVEYKSWLSHCLEKERGKNGGSLRHGISSLKFSPNPVLQGQPAVCMAECLGHSGTNTPRDNASTPTLASFSEV